MDVSVGSGDYPGKAEQSPTNPEEASEEKAAAVKRDKGVSDDIFQRPIRTKSGQTVPRAEYHRVHRDGQKDGCRDNAKRPGIDVREPNRRDPEQAVDKNDHQV